MINSGDEVHLVNHEINHEIVTTVHTKKRFARLKVRSLANQYVYEIDVKDPLRARNSQGIVVYTTIQKVDEAI